MGAVTNYTLYYPEAVIHILGRNSRKISIEEAMNIKKEGAEKYGHRLKLVEIEYKTKKDGIKITYLTCPREIADQSLELKHRPTYDQTSILYGRVGQNEPIKYFVDNETLRIISRGEDKKIKNEKYEIQSDLGYPRELRREKNEDH